MVGEPTGLDLAVAQKGLLVLELVARGDACHAAHAAALGAANAARRLARDLVALEGDRLRAAAPAARADHPGAHRRCAPAPRATWCPARPRRCSTCAPRRPCRAREIVRAGRARRWRARCGCSPTGCARARPPSRRRARRGRAARARPEARLYGSPTLSDMAFLDGVPAVKCGPGRSERSHTPDEFVLESEVLDGARFYTRLIGAYAECGDARAAPPPRRGERA